jgi:methylglutaconyl-CoA hydratase
MAFNFLQTRVDSGVEYLTLNRPDVRNAFNEGMIAELTAWAGDLPARAERGDIRAVVVSGAGKVFCAGADIDWMARTARYSTDENLADAAAASRMFTAIDTLPVPLIGRVHGAAIGGGAGLAAVCDMVVADEQAVFGFSEVRLGIVPAVISPFVITKIGRSAARELFLTGSRFPAAHARQIGLVHRVVPIADLDDAVARYVEDVLAGGPGALRAAKQLVADVWRHEPAATSDLTTETIARLRVSAEGQEGLRAFLEKRSPGWARAPSDASGRAGRRAVKPSEAALQTDEDVQDAAPPR